MRLAEEHRAEIGAVLQDVGHLFRRVHSGRQSIAVGHVHQMPAGRQSPPLCAHARNEPRQRVRVLYYSNVDFILFVFFLLVGASALGVHPQGRSFNRGNNNQKTYLVCFLSPTQQVRLFTTNFDWSDVLVPG